MIVKEGIEVVTKLVIGSKTDGVQNSITGQCLHLFLIINIGGLAILDLFNYCTRVDSNIIYGNFSFQVLFIVQALVGVLQDVW